MWTLKRKCSVLNVLQSSAMLSMVGDVSNLEGGASSVKFKASLFSRETKDTQQDPVSKKWWGKGKERKGDTNPGNFKHDIRIASTRTVRIAETQPPAPLTLCHTSSKDVHRHSYPLYWLLSFPHFPVLPSTQTPPIAPKVVNFSKIFSWQSVKWLHINNLLLLGVVAHVFNQGQRTCVSSMIAWSIQDKQAYRVKIPSLN